MFLRNRQFCFNFFSVSLNAKDKTKKIDEKLKQTIGIDSETWNSEVANQCAVPTRSRVDRLTRIKTKWFNGSWKYTRVKIFAFQLRFCSDTRQDFEFRCILHMILHVFTYIQVHQFTFYSSQRTNRDDHKISKPFRDFGMLFIIPWLGTLCNVNVACADRWSIKLAEVSKGFAIEHRH